MPALKVVIYSKTVCSLCDEALAVVERVRERLPFDLSVVDIATLSHEDRLRYRYELPVVFVNGTDAFHHRVNEQRFEALLSAGTAVAQTGPGNKVR